MDYRNDNAKPTMGTATDLRKGIARIAFVKVHPPLATHTKTYCSERPDHDKQHEPRHHHGNDGDAISEGGA
jgi:hypothetical protein